MNETVLVTGGTGFIGSHVIEHLLTNGYRVILLKRSFSKTWRIEEFKDKITCYNIDEIELDKIFRKESITAIIHLATYYKKHHTQEDIDPMIRSNILFPVELLENARKFDVKIFINTGTFFEYAYDTLPIHENSYEKPFNFYAITKLAFENILKSYTKKEDIKSITLKIFSPYGPRDNEEKIVPLLINHTIKDKEIKLSHGLQKLDFIYVKDIAEAYISSLKNISLIEEYEAIN
ncbi:MAG: NAD-dependent epimerase/dehydratase family protein, partial [Methanobacterium sp.]|uniref:NAD-dependent epimerase/dehydratase family protein n=2 Tax=Methanobacterium sp. TaxID=2164 RepID=UPI003C7908EF